VIQKKAQHKIQGEEEFFFTARSNFMRKSSKNYDKKREKLHNTAYENIK
jgi:hypothetical protein